MLRRDYIMRLVQQLARILARVMALRQEGKYEEAHSQIRNATRWVAGWDPEFIHAMADSEILALLSPGGRLELEKVSALARLLREEGEVYEAEGRPREARASYEKALGLYEASPVDEGDAAGEERAAALEALRAKLGTGGKTETQQ